MRKIFATVLLLCVASAALGSTEYLRPTADAQSTANVGCAFNGADVVSSSMSAVYSSKSGVGPTGSSATLVGTYSAGQKYEERIFSTWQSAVHTPYSVLTLNVSIAHSSLGTGAAACIGYSTNGGSSWTSLGTITTSQSTLSATITGASLSSVEVGVLSTSPSSVGTTTITVYDIWTEGIYGVTSSAFPGFIRSALDEQIWRLHGSRHEWRG